MNPIDRMQTIPNPRSQKAQGKQRHVDTMLEPVPQQDVFGMNSDYAVQPSTELPYRLSGVDVPLSLGSQIYSVPQPTMPYPYGPKTDAQPTQFLLKNRPKAPAYPQPDSKDPSFYRLPPIREREISAPLQPRVTDMRVHVEKDHQQTKPAFDVTIRFQFQMEPGQLQ